MTEPAFRSTDSSRSLPRPRRDWPVQVVHGGPDSTELARLGLEEDGLLDFSVCSNPLGASPRALQALGRVDPSRYPDRQALRLRTALAGVEGVDLGEVLVGNGSVELIWLLAQVYLEAGDRALVFGPTFGEYEAAIRRQRAEALVFCAAAADDFRPNLAQLGALARSVHPRLIFVCNPNNPTGQTLSLEELQALLAACGETLLIIDEAYLDFLDDRSSGGTGGSPVRLATGEPPVPPIPQSSLPLSRSSALPLRPPPSVQSALALRRDPRVVVLRSLTKSFGLAGLRLGYAVAAPEVVEALGRAQPPWSVNALAQAAGLAALEDREHVAAGWRVAAEAKAYLIEQLMRLGLRCLPTRTSFWLVEVRDGTALRQALLRHGILVRDCASFGLPEYVRLAARPLPECERLVEALEAVLSERRP